MIDCLFIWVGPKVANRFFFFSFSIVNWGEAAQFPGIGSLSLIFAFRVIGWSVERKTDLLSDLTSLGRHQKTVQMILRFMEIVKSMVSI